MRKLFVLSAIASVSLFLAFAPHDDEGAADSDANSAAAGIGGVGPFNAENIEILGHLTLAEMGAGQANIRANDCWGWTDPLDGKEYAICGLSHATSFVDVSDPADPLFLGRMLTQNGTSTWRDMKVYNNYAFVVSDGSNGHGIQVFDLTQLRTADPGNPLDYPADVYYPDSGHPHNIAINIETGFAYTVGGTADGGLHAVNIQDPLNLFEAGNFADDGYTHDAVIVSYIGPDSDYAGQEIAFACNTDTLTIVDVTDKANMVQVSRNEYPERGYTHQCWMTDDHRYIYLGDEADENSFGGSTRVIVFDCLDLDNPVYLGYFSAATGAIDHNMFVKGDKLFLSNYAAGMRVYQIDPLDPLNLTEIGFVDTYMPDDDTDFDGVWANYPFFASGNIVISDRQNGLFVVRMNQVAFEYPNGRPDLIDPDGELEFTVTVSPGIDGSPAAGSGMLHVDLGNGFETFPMNEVSSNLYEAVFPPTDCGSVIRYYVSATSVAGIQSKNPSNAPSITYSAKSADSVSFGFADDFESDQGWTVSGDALEGLWERGVPMANGAGDPPVDGDGSGACYVTGNGSAKNGDVDQGTTILTSPLMDAVVDGTSTAAFLNYYRWYLNDFGNDQAFDLFEIEISNDDGESWTSLETVGPGGNEVSGGWFYKSFDISDFVVPTDEMRVRFIVSDAGDDSPIEAGVDGVEIQLIHCDELLLGDVNLDGSVNLLDVNPFVELLSNGGYLAEADMNQDGEVNLLDVGLFIEAISQ